MFGKQFTVELMYSASIEYSHNSGEIVAGYVLLKYDGCFL